MRIKYGDWASVERAGALRETPAITTVARVSSRRALKGRTSAILRPGWRGNVSSVAD
jgi:hypothetical protein